MGPPSDPIHTSSPAVRPGQRQVEGMQAVLSFGKGFFLRPDLVLGCCRIPVAALCLSSSPIISRCRPREEMLLEAAAAAGSCVLAPSLTELKHTTGCFFFFLFFIIYFLNYRLLLEVFWQQRGNGYMTTKGSVQINYPLNTTVSKVKE